MQIWNYTIFLKFFVIRFYLNKYFFKITIRLWFSYKIIYTHLLFAFHLFSYKCFPCNSGYSFILSFAWQTFDFCDFSSLFNVFHLINRFKITVFDMLNFHCKFLNSINIVLIPPAPPCWPELKSRVLRLSQGFIDERISWVYMICHRLLPTGENIFVSWKCFPSI